MKRACTIAVAILLAWAGVASAQIATGNIYGTAVDQQGGVLPGATVTLTATSIGGQPRTTVTDTSGQFRFLNLDAGNYRIEVDMPGFTKQSRDVIVNTGINTTVAFATFLVLFVGGILLTWPEVPWGTIGVITIAAMAIVPILFYPLSKTVWMAIEMGWNKPT